MSSLITWASKWHRVQSRQNRQWGARALFAVLDQGLISGSNFLLGIQLARCLHAADYGAYALAFSVFSLLLVVDQAFILEPMSVFGGSKYAGVLQRYLGQLLRFQILIGTACLAILLATAIIIHAARPSGELTLSLAGIALATPCILLLYFTRRALYLEYRSNAAAAGALLYSLLLLVMAWLLARVGFLSSLTAFLSMGGAALATSALLFFLIRPVLRGRNGEAERKVAHEHWGYGRWAFGSAVFTWISWNVWYAIAGAFSGLAGTGALRALVNLAMPIIQSCAVLSLLVLPHMSRVAYTHGPTRAKRQALVVASLFAAGASVYWALVLALQSPIITFLYSGRYADSASCLPWLAFASIASAAAVGPVAALRALERPSAVCMAFFVSSLAGVAIGVPATRAYGVNGAVAGILLSSMLAVVIAVFTLARTGQPNTYSCAPDVADAVIQ